MLVAQLRSIGGSTRGAQLEPEITDTRKELAHNDGRADEVVWRRYGPLPPPGRAIMRDGFAVALGTGVVHGSFLARLMLRENPVEEDPNTRPFWFVVTMFDGIGNQLYQYGERVYH